MCIKPLERRTLCTRTEPQLLVGSVTTMPKNAPQSRRPESPRIVCRKVGSNGTVFILQGADDDAMACEPSNCGSKADNPPQAPPRKAGTAAFVAILLHALKCSECDQVSCRKMRMVLRHYKACSHKRLSAVKSGVPSQNQACKLCRQLLRIVGHHSKFLCKLPADRSGCPVLMCDSFRISSLRRQIPVPRPGSAVALPKLEVCRTAVRRGVSTQQV